MSFKIFADNVTFATGINKLGISCSHHTSARIGTAGESVDPNTNRSSDFINYVIAHHVSLLRAAAARECSA